MSRIADTTAATTPADDTPRISSARIPPERRLPPPPGQRRQPGWLIWGGIGAAAIATAAVGVVAIRAFSGDEEDRPRRPRHAPRYDDPDPDERHAMRARARAEFSDYDQHAARLRAQAREDMLAEARARRRAARNTPRRSSFLSDLGDSAGRVATNLTGLLAAANAASEGFRQVSGRADGIVRDFVNAADRLNGFLARRNGPEPKEADTSARPADRDDRRMHKL
ncbi:MAG: hypothetical protein Q4G25_13925 [Paracoccus sp. (in: a-proteobacteria)]|nr:hypothetical protein [Paracoccus sp. (in: a-proteobacteria)]